MSVIAEIHKDLEHGVIRMIAEYRDRLMAEAFRLCQDESTAEDLVSSTFSKAIRNFDSYKVDDNFFGWLKTIMVNAYRSDLRNPVTRGTTPTDPDLLATDESLVTNETEDRILKDSDHDALREAVGRLPPIYRRAVVLHYFEEFSIKDVAIALHAPVGTIFRRLNVARKLLAKDLAVKLGKKKPLVILLALLFGAGALFGAWQAGEAIVEAMSEGGEAVSMNPPTIEDNQPTLTTADPDEPVMTYPTFSSTTTTTEKEVNKQEESVMTTMKKTLLAAVSAVSLMSAGSADAYQDLKTYLMPSGATATDTDMGFKYEYMANGTTYYVEVFTSSGSWTVPDGAYWMDYLVVGGGGAGGSKAGGGGGAGGMLNSTEPVLVSPKMILTASVGKGGTGVASASGNSGEDSVLTIPTLASPITAYGGGYGGYQAPGGAGGSGGGGGVAGKAGGATRDSAQGFEGGSAGSNYSGCGGGAGEKGGTGQPGKAGRACSITGKDVVFAGGGGCASSTKNANYLNTWGSGGSGIGGNGGASSGTVLGAAGMDGTGSGGGGNGNSTNAGGKGGDGIIIIRYTITETSAYPITINAAQNGTISGAVSGQEIPAGLAITLEAVPDDGYELENWTVNGVDVGSENPLVLTMNAAKTVSATFRIIQWASQELKAYLMPEGAANVQDTPNRGFSYAYLDGNEKYVVEVFARPSFSMTWTVPDDVTAIDYLVVGGGGAGGSTYSGLSTSSAGGGGGAGGMLASSEPVAVAAGSEISILVGAGGIGVAGKSGKSGENSVLTIPALSSPITALGGGYGGQNNTAGGSGGSGGGGGAQRYQAGGAAGTTRDSAQGCDGGKGGDTYGGCGGGAGAAGDPDGKPGAAGRSCAITGKDVIFAGGGGCGGRVARDFSKWGTGGSGIGGYGGSSTAGDTLGAAGMDGTGSGGGGNGTSADAGGKGGDGIVIIRYLAPLKDNVTVAHAGEVAYGAALLNPTYGDYAIGDYATYTAPTFAETETAGVRAYCLGWQLLDKYDFPSGELNPSTTATPEYTDGGYTVQWNWELRYTVAATPIGSGSVSGAGDYVEGATVTLVATAVDGSHFAGWEGAPAGATTIEETTLVFTMGTAQVNVTAKFDEDIEKGVTVASEGGNYGTPSPAYGTYAGYADGSERTYSMAETVIGDGGEKIYLAGWKLLTGTGEFVRDSDTGLHDGESISLVKFTCSTDEAFTLVWKWEMRYTLTAVANPAEGGTITGTGDYAAESEVTLTANVTGGYKLTGWEGAPDDATEDGSTLTFAMPAEATTVTANFEMVPWGITVVSGVTTNDYREKCEPNKDYEFQSPLYYNVQEGVSRKHCLGYTLTPMREDGEESELKEAKLEGETLTATVTYAEPVKLTWQWADDYYFALAQDGEGTVTGSAEGWYASGTEFTLTATPAKNYEFLCWMGSVSGTDTTITGTITKPTSVKAFFSPVQQVKSDWEAIEGKPAMMRTVKSLGKTYCVVKFTDSTTFDIPKKVTSIDCLVVGGGGGGGGAKSGGGGGAGGFNYQTGLAVTPEDQLTVTVGAGGAGGTYAGVKGNDTTLKFGGQTITAQGGGFGGYDRGTPGKGASGGGSSGNVVGTYSETEGGESTAVAPEQGNPGGSRPITAISGKKCGAGGGGAGCKGGDVGNGKGGDGLPSAITGETVWYAAGGAGGASNYLPGDGAANTGSGGGGGSADAGFAGGSGVVIIRYALPSQGAMILIF